MKRNLVKWAGLLLSTALIAWIVTRFDVAASLEALGRAELGWLLLATLVYVSLFPLRGLRWAILMRPIKNVSVGTASQVFVVGFMANNILPARLGDVARAFLLARRERISASSTFSNVLLERIFDGLTVVGFLSLVLYVEPPSASWVSSVGLLMALAFLGGIVVSGMIAWNEALVVRLAHAVTRWLPGAIRERIVGIIVKLGRGMHTLRSADQTLKVLGLSLAIWTIEVVVYALVQRAFGLQMPTLGLVVVMSVLTLGLTAPSAPGFVGVFEGLVLAGVALYGVTEPLALAFAITLHLIHYVPGTVLGLGLAWANGLKLSELQNAAAASSDAAEETGAVGAEAASP